MFSLPLSLSLSLSPPLSFSLVYLAKVLCSPGGFSLIGQGVCDVLGQCRDYISSMRACCTPARPCMFLRLLNCLVYYTIHLPNIFVYCRETHSWSSHGLRPAHKKALTHGHGRTSVILMRLYIIFIAIRKFEKHVLCFELISCAAHAPRYNK